MSKGSRPRPYSVSLDQYGNNFDAIFRKNKSPETELSENSEPVSEQTAEKKESDKDGGLV